MVHYRSLRSIIAVTPSTQKHNNGRQPEFNRFSTGRCGYTTVQQFSMNCSTKIHCFASRFRCKAKFHSSKYPSASRRHHNHCGGQFHIWQAINRIWVCLTVVVSLELPTFVDTPICSQGMMNCRYYEWCNDAQWKVGWRFIWRINGSWFLKLFVSCFTMGYCWWSIDG